MRVPRERRRGRTERERRGTGTERAHRVEGGAEREPGGGGGGGGAGGRGGGERNTRDRQHSFVLSLAWFGTQPRSIGSLGTRKVVLVRTPSNRSAHFASVAGESGGYDFSLFPPLSRSLPLFLSLSALSRERRDSWRLERPVARVPVAPLLYVLSRGDQRVVRSSRAGRRATVTCTAEVSDSLSKGKSQGIPDRWLEASRDASVRELACLRLALYASRNSGVLVSRLLRLARAFAHSLARSLADPAADKRIARKSLTLGERELLATVRSYLAKFEAHSRVRVCIHVCGR